MGLAAIAIVVAYLIYSLIFNPIRYGSSNPFSQLHDLTSSSRHTTHTSPDKDLPDPYKNKNNEAPQVTVLYGTNRKSTDQACSFGAERSKHNVITYGSCTISIPPDHRMGVIEAPSMLWGKERPEKHVMLVSGQSLNRSEFRAMVSNLSKDSGASLVFVHGYNVPFLDAAKRTAQMTYDLKFQGAPVFFSWPSAGSEGAYMADEATVEWSYPSLYTFLKDLLDDENTRNVYLIGHSMGTRALTHALTRLYTEQPKLAEKLREVILAAPDIDAATFIDNIAPSIVKKGAPVTLYASSNDRALQASKTFHSFRRAGDFATPVTLIDGVELIDASPIKTDFIAHSYYGDSSSIIVDIYETLQGKRPSHRFNLTTIKVSEGSYWRVRN